MAAVALAACVGARAETARPDPSVVPGEAGQLWKNCDGYGGPSTSGDGMTTYAATWFIFIPNKGGDTFRKNPVARRESIAACDQDLTDPLIQERFPMRRASLLRAKAIHQIAAENPRGALETLDLADKVRIEGDDTYYRRSFGVGLDYVRAYALSTLGEREAARAATAKAWTQRPYATGSALANAILMSRAGHGDDAHEALLAMARLDPRKIDLLFGQAWDNGRWAEVVDLFPQLMAPRRFPAAPGYNFQVVQSDLENRALGEAFWAARGALQAVALANLGRVAEAREAIRRGRARADEASKTVPPLEYNGKIIKSKWLPDYAVKLNASIAEKTPPLFDQAEREVDRIERTGPPPARPTKGANPLGEAEEELSALLSSLPEVEIADRTPAYAPMSKAFLANDDGYTEAPGATPGSTKIRFRSHVAAPAVVDEIALLRAASLTREQGKPGFIILDRKNTQHTLAVSTYPGIPGTPGPDGYSAEVVVLPVDPAALPEAYRQARWRVVDADVVIATLAPVYPPKH